MALNVGSRLGHYDVTALIGEGGMGRVYRATDTKLNRQVALKILPEAFAADPDRLTRFQREAQVLASLNHPGIAAIYGLEEAEGTRALVLELVEGPTLADRIAQGAIPLDEALPIAKQIAEALEAAHEAGVIHRDLKPANIKVKEDGTVKVLDFGLAKALDLSPEGDPSRSPTLTAAATASGVILGTAAYMSPEQARGKPVDRRSDIWAFGAVLFEMVTGQRPFEGRDVSEVLGAVLRLEPAWGTLPADTPLYLNALLKRCLEKEPRQRVQAVGDVRLAMEGGFETTIPEPSDAVGVSVPVPKRAWWTQVLPLALVALVVGSVATGLSVWNLRPTAPERLVHLVVNTPLDGPLVLRGSRVQPGVAISPDGSRIVYRSGTPGATGGQLYLRDLGQSEATLIRGTEGANGPFFSPDGEWMAFQDGRDRALKRVPVLGGPPLTICPLESRLQGATWGPDDTIVFGQTSGGLMRVPAVGGEPEVLTTIDADMNEGNHWWPDVLPSGQAVLFTAWSGSSENSRIGVVSLDTGTVSYLISAGSSPRFAQTGHIVYAVGGALRAVGFDPDRLEVIGNPVPVVENVTMGPNGEANFVLSPDGSIVYVSGGEASNVERTLVWVDRQGQPTPFIDATADYRYPQLSPDETRVAVNIGDDIWICESGRACSPLTTEGGNYPLWTPDGTHVAFHASREGDFDLYWQPADGSGEAERLLERERTQYPVSWSPDGQVLAFSEPRATGGGLDNFLLPLGGEPEEYVATAFDERTPTFSPNGRWIAYRASVFGETQIYVRPYPGPGGRQLVSLEGGAEPMWARDGRELFFRDGDRLMAVEVGDSETFSPEIPRLLFEGYDVWGGSRNYDVSLDGQRFLMVMSQESQSGEQPEIHVVLNWHQELLERVPVP